MRRSSSGDDTFEAGIPESFNVLVKEMRSLGLNVDLSDQRDLGHDERRHRDRGGVRVSRYADTVLVVLDRLQQVT